jgi:hypothetical protein
MPQRVFIRRLWVIGINGYFLYSIVSHLVALAQVQRTDELRGFRMDLPGIDSLVRIVCLIAGIALELTGRKAARYVNVGYFTAIFVWAACSTAAEAAGLFDASGMTLVFLQEEGLPALVIAVITWLFYRTKKIKSPSVEPAAK